MTFEFQHGFILGSYLKQPTAITFQDVSAMHPPSPPDPSCISSSHKINALSLTWLPFAAVAAASISLCVVLLFGNHQQWCRLKCYRMCFWPLGAACCCSTGGCEARQSSPFVKKGRTKPAAICMMDLYDVDFYSPSGFIQAFAGRHSRWRLPSKWNEMKWNYLSVRRAFVWWGWGGLGGISREKWD